MEWVILALAAIGLGVGVWSAVDSHNQKEEELETQKENLSLRYKEAYTSAIESLEGYDSKITDAGVQLQENKGNLASYEELLGRWQGNYNYAMAQQEASAYSTYKDLIDNWSGSEVVSASRGQSGRTALALAGRSNKELRMYFGDDLRMNSASEMSAEGFDFEKNGGILGMAWRDQHLDLLADKRGYESKIADLTGAIRINEETISNAVSGIKDTLPLASELAANAGITDTSVIDAMKEKYGVKS